MASVMAIVSKAVFEKDARRGAAVLGHGEVWATDRYVSQNKALAGLAEGGDLYLVTVRPPDEALWLVAVLRAPQSADGMWRAEANVAPITNISAKKGDLRFSTGVGIAAKPGALGMSLQTPRILTDADIAVLEGGAPAATASPAVAPPPPAPKPKKAAAPPPAPGGGGGRR